MRKWCMKLNAKPSGPGEDLCVDSIAAPMVEELKEKEERSVRGVVV